MEDDSTRPPSVGCEGRNCGSASRRSRVRCRPKPRALRPHPANSPSADTPAHGHGGTRQPASRDRQNVRNRSCGCLCDADWSQIRREHISWWTGAPQYSCTTPCSMELPAGRHTIAATLEGYRRTLKIFETPGSEDIFLNLDRTSGTLMVRSEPRGAEIMVDGQTRSEKTPGDAHLPTGRHNIEVSAGRIAR